MTATLGYRGCGEHGSGGYGTRKIDINCPNCVVWPKRKADVEYLKDLRVILGLERELPPLVGDQLSLL